MQQAQNDEQWDESRELLEHDVEQSISRADRLLLWLLKHPFQRDEDLAFAFSLHQSSVVRLLSSLEQSGMIEAIKASGYPRAVVLTQAGLQHVADVLGAVPEKLARMWKVRESDLLPQFARLPVLFRVQDAVKSLVQQVPIYFEGEDWRWHWVGNYETSFQGKRNVQRCQVDAAVVLSAGAKGKRSYTCCFLLLDAGLTGQYDLQIIRPRLEALLRFRESPDRWSHYRAFPLVLMVVPSRQQQAAWIRCATEVAERLGVAPLKALVAVWPEEQELLSFWTLPWREVETNAPCRLQEQIRFVEQAALPPGVLAVLPALEPETFVLHPVRAQHRSIRGQWMLRAAQITTTLSSRAERAFLGLRMQPRQWKLLHLVATYPLITRKELAPLTPWKPETLTRYLSALLIWGCLEVVSTSQGQRLRLTEVGTQLLAWRLSTIPSVLIQRLSGSSSPEERGVNKTLRHRAGLYHFLGLLAQTPSVLWWEHGVRCERRYRHQGVWHVICPDAIVMTRIGYWWVEWDEGTMRNRLWSRKLRGYQGYVRSRQWVRVSPYTPGLLVVVPDPEQEQRVVRLTRRLLPSLKILVTTRTRLESQGLDKDIWLNAHKEDRQHWSLT